MATNNFLPFGAAGGANVISQSDYAALSSRTNGFISGVAQSAQVNKVWRQAAMGAAALGQFAADLSGLDVLDDGNIASFLDPLKVAIRSQALNYVVASGAANALTATVTPAPASLAVLEGVPFRVKMPFTNTGATTFKINALAAAPVVRANGSILFDGDLVTGGIYVLVYDGSSFRAITLTAPPALIRPVTLYVNAAIGSDSNDGTANVAGKALASIQGAVDRAWSYGPGPYTITILVAAGNYAYVETPSRPGPKLDIQGTGAIAADVNIVASAGFDAFSTKGTSVVNVSRVKVNNTTGSGGFVGYDQSVLFVNNCETGPCSAAAVQAFGGASVSLFNHRYSGSTFALYLSNVSGKLNIGGLHTITTPITVSCTAFAANLGSIAVSVSNPLIYSGAGNVTGQRYLSATNAVIDSAAGGANFFPGTVAGSVGTGGQYV